MLLSLNRPVCRLSLSGFDPLLSRQKSVSGQVASLRQRCQQLQEGGSQHNCNQVQDGKAHDLPLEQIERIAVLVGAEEVSSHADLHEHFCCSDGLRYKAAAHEHAHDCAYPH